MVWSSPWHLILEVSIVQDCQETHSTHFHFYDLHRGTSVASGDSTTLMFQGELF